jgi:hypothetical protein
VVEVDGHGRSDPFWIGDHLFEGLATRLAYQHFIDVRGGEDPSVSPARITGGGPSRDGGGQTLEALFEILLYASNPALFDRWTEELEPKDTPDLVNLILWHAAFAFNNLHYTGTAGGYETWVRDFGYQGKPRQSFDHQNLLDQLAAVVGAYHPFLHRYLDEDTYRKYLFAARQLWETFDRHKEVRYWVNSQKWIDEGFREFSEQGNAYGQAVFRNLFIYLAEREEEDGRPEKYLTYAQDAARDIVQNWDFDNPWHMWAMRNAEHITPQALAFFLMVAPEHAPAGAHEKLGAWRDYILARTDNLWQYRTHSDTEWAHPRSKEVGTVAGLGGSMFAVAHLLDDPKLREVGWSQVNFVFGLNPVGAALSAKTKARVERNGYWLGVERGWPDVYGYGTGFLKYARGSLDGSPLNQAFPYAPEDFRGTTERHYATEGWAISNRAWMSTVTFSTLDSHRLRVLDPRTGSPLAAIQVGDSVRVELKAALNLDYGDPEEGRPENSDAAESGWVEVRVNDGAPRRIPVKETDLNTGLFRATLRVTDRGVPDASTLVTRRGDRVEFSYGYLGFQKTAALSVR